MLPIVKYPPLKPGTTQTCFSCLADHKLVVLPVLLTIGTDCTQIKARLPQAPSGVYVIQPDDLKDPFEVRVRVRVRGQAQGALSWYC